MEDACCLLDCILIVVVRSCKNQDERRWKKGLEGRTEKKENVQAT